MAHLTLYHNPGCSKSRGALEILRERGVAFEIVEYLQQPPDREALERIARALPGAPEELVRKDRHFEQLGLDPAGYQSGEAVVELLLEHPQLMQRPILVADDRARICRPSEKALELL